VEKREESDVLGAGTRNKQLQAVKSRFKFRPFPLERDLARGEGGGGNFWRGESRHRNERSKKRVNKASIRSPLAA